jgi:hypothetical protein
VFLPQWIGHAGHAALVVFVLSSVVSRQQQNWGEGCAGWRSFKLCLLQRIMSSVSIMGLVKQLHSVACCVLTAALHAPLTLPTCHPVLTVQDKLVRQQLGPAPPATASPGMILQYNTMFSERKRSLFIDNVNGLIESAAALLVKVRADSAAR